MAESRSSDPNDRLVVLNDDAQPETHCLKRYWKSYSSVVITAISNFFVQACAVVVVPEPVVSSGPVVSFWTRHIATSVRACVPDYCCEWPPTTMLSLPTQVPQLLQYNYELLNWANLWLHGIYGEYKSWAETLKNPVETEKGLDRGCARWRRG
jgi:hypothetical protein